MSAAIRCPKTGLLPGVNSIAVALCDEIPDASCWTPHFAVAAHDDGTVRLWDTRANSKPAAYVVAKRMPGTDSLEVANVGDRFASIVLCESSVCEIDWRNASGGPCRALSHSCDLAALDKRSAWSGWNDAHPLLLCDDNGATLSVAEASANTAQLVASAVYGAHDSIPCAVARLRHSSVSLSIGMEGIAKLWDVNAGTCAESGTIVNALSGGGAAQIANPPLPTCADVCANGLVVGRGDGGFMVGRLPSGEEFNALLTNSVRTGMFEKMPLLLANDSFNGLVGVAWCAESDNNVLMTADATGTVALWTVPEAWTSLDADGGDDDAAVECMLELRLREIAPFTGKLAAIASESMTLNAAAVSGTNVFLGDNAGRLHVVPIA
jgi:WD40 repeat protein